MANAVNDSGETCLLLTIKEASAGNMATAGLGIGMKDLYKHQDTRVNDVVRLLLDHGAEVNARDRKGRTALMHAVTSFNVTAVRLLLEHGADRNLVDENGKTALQQMLDIRIIKDRTKAISGKERRSFMSLPPEYLAQSLQRADQILLELESDH
jgi:ankyrin repeat protein